MGNTVGASWLGRTLGPSLPETLNVVNFGADPTGVADSASAIQSCFASAFGATNSPVYFPAGTYKISKTLLITQVEDGWIFGAGSALTKLLFAGNVPPTATIPSANMTLANPCVITLNSHGYSGGEIFSFQPTGDTLPSPVVFGVAYYVLPTGLTTNTFRFSISAGGTAVSTNGSSQSGTHEIITSLIKTNGYDFNKMEGLTLDISGTQTVCLNLDYQASGGGAHNVNGNTFIDIVTKNATSGVICGLSGIMGSEMCFVDSTFQDHSLAAVVTANGNALGEQFYNCTFLRCGGYTSATINGGGAALLSNTGNPIIIAGGTFVDSGFLDSYTNSADCKLVIDTHSTNASTLLPNSGTLSIPGPMFGSENNQIFFQSSSYSAPFATGSPPHANLIAVDPSSYQIYVNCAFPDGNFRALGGGGNKLYTVGGAFADPTFASFVADGGTAVQAPTTNTITALNIPYAIPDFICSPPPPQFNYSSFAVSIALPMMLVLAAI